MRVIVTLCDGGADKYMRNGDTYVKHDDGKLDMIRAGAKQPYRYTPGVWTDVEGDQKNWRKGHFWS